MLVNKDGTRRLYFVVETKSSLFTDDLRNKERAKIACGEAHFHALAVGENPARYVVARSVDDVLVDSMRGRSSTWTRIRVNLRHVPEDQRPPQETPDPDDDPTR